jgi:DNA-binding MarR family transcriptional regulator
MEPSPRVDGTPSLRLLRDLVTLGRLVHQLIDPPLRRELGLSSTEVYVLRSLTFGVTRPGAIARRLNLGPPHVSRSVALLEALGFVERRPGAGDGRASELALTIAGCAALDAALVVVQGAYEQTYGHLEPALVERGSAALEELVRAMTTHPTPST